MRARQACLATGVALLVLMGAAGSAAAADFTPAQHFDPTAGDGVTVSCGSPTLCVALDHSGNAYRWNGSGWSGPVQLTTASDWQISCRSSAFCMASGDGQYRTYDGVNWSPAMTIAGPSVTNESAFDCASASYCLAAFGPDGLWAYTATGWHATATAPPQGLYGLSCTPSTWCFGLNGPGTQAYGYDGSTFASLGSPPLEEPLSYSCSSSAFCAVGDFFSGGVALYRAGSGWTTSGSLISALPLVDYQSITSVSCPSDGFCLAGGSGLAVVLSNGSWTLPTALDGGARVGPEASLGCASSSWCMAVNTAGDWMTYDASRPTVAPAAVNPPRIDEPKPNQLVSDDGRWLHLPTRLTRQWEQCDPTGQQCQDMAGQTGQSIAFNDDPSNTTRYRVRVTESNAAGHATSISDPFPTPAVSPPQASTGPVTNVRTNRATLAGSLTNVSGSLPSCVFAWGPSDGPPTHTTPCDALTTAGSTASGSATITGLVPGTSYAYHIIWSGSGGPWSGEDALFTTPGGGDRYTFGEAAVGDGASSFVTDAERVNPYALYQAGTVRSMSIYLQPTGIRGTERLRLLVYADQSGVPGQLLATTGVLAFHSSDPAGWYTLPLPHRLALATGTYWLGVLTGGKAEVAGWRYADAGVRDYRSVDFADGPTNPFGATDTDQSVMSLYASLTPAAAHGAARRRERALQRAHRLPRVRHLRCAHRCHGPPR